MAAGIAIGEGLNRIYTWYFLRTLKPKALAMAARFPGLLDPVRVALARTMWDFDDTVTAPLHGFAGTRGLLDSRLVEAVAGRGGTAHARAERAKRPVRARHVAAALREISRAVVSSSRRGAATAAS